MNLLVNESINESIKKEVGLYRIVDLYTWVVVVQNRVVSIVLCILCIYVRIHIRIRGPPALNVRGEERGACMIYDDVRSMMMCVLVCVYVRLCYYIIIRSRFFPSYNRTEVVYPRQTGKPALRPPSCIGR